MSEKKAPPIPVFGPGWEGAQYGGTPLEEFLDQARDAGAKFVQPSTYQLHTDDKWTLRDPDEVREMIAARGLLWGSVSAHCPHYVATGGMTVYGGDVDAFLRPDMLDMSEGDVVKAMTDYTIGFYDWCVKANISLVAMFWGPLYYRCSRGRVSANLDSRYYWPFQKANGWEEGLGNFVEDSRELRDGARERGLFQCHELHPKSAAWNRHEWRALLKAVGSDKVMALISDVSHCWNRERWQTLLKDPDVASRVLLAHAKSFFLADGEPVLTHDPEWQNRGQNFCPLDDGEVNMREYARVLMQIGYPERYMRITGHDRTPLHVEAEAAYEDGLATSIRGIQTINEQCCWFGPAVSFEKGMGDSGDTD